MRQTLKALGFLAALLPSLAAAQTQLPTLPANTVLGRLGISAGTAQAIPLSQLGPSLITNYLAVTSPLTISGLNLSITGAAGKVMGGASAAFTATPQLGVASTTTGSLAFANSGNTGVVTVQAASSATSWTFKFPTTAGSNGQALITDGSGNTSWAAGTGTVNSGVAGQLTYYATTAAAVSGNANLNVSGGALQIGIIGGAGPAGTLVLAGLTSSATTLAAPTTGGGTMTFPAGTDTVMSLAATQTATNKTFTSPTLNSPTMTTPTLGVAAATSINKVAITAPASGSTLTIADGKTLTDTSGVGASVLLGTTGGGFSAYAGASCTNQFIRSLSAAAAATCASVANTDLSNSSITIGSTNVALGATAATIAGLTLTAPTINGGTHTAITSFGIRSSGTGAFDMVLANTENLTASRTLTVTMNNAARSINMSGNLTLAGDLTTATGNAITLTTTGTTNVTLPTSGTLAAINIAQTFSSPNIFSAVQQFTDAKFSSGKIYPTSDSTTALQVTKADGSTAFVTFDSTNRRVGINKTPGSFDLDVNGAVNVGGVLSFLTLDPTSLGTSTTTVTGLTVNNSPSSSNDYIPYYSAADGRIRKATVGSIAAGATAGVSSLNGLTGGLSVAQGTGITVSAVGTTVTVTNTNVSFVTPQGRLTTTTLSPVVVSSVAAATTLYYTPYVGNLVPMYDGTNMVSVAFAEISQATSDTTQSPAAVANSSCYDNFAWNPSSPKLSRGPAWTNTTTRSAGTALVLVNGIYLNSVAITNGPGASRGTYVGTFCSNGTATIDWSFGATAAGGTPGNLNIWNAYNRVQFNSFSGDTAATWTYAVANTWRAANGSANIRTTLTRGLNIDPVEAKYNAIGNVGTTTGGVNVYAGVGVDSTTAVSGTTGFLQSNTTFNFTGTASGQYDSAPNNGGYPGIGQHFFSAIESQNFTSTTTWFGFSSGAYQTGINVKTWQ